MAILSTQAMCDAISCLQQYDTEKAQSIRDAEDKTDHYEDTIGTYLVKLSSRTLNEREGAEASMLLKAIGDLERISDHAVNVLESAEEMKEKDIRFTSDAQKEMDTLCDATLEILSLSYKAFCEHSIEQANCVEPLEQIIDRLKEHLRKQHIDRLCKGNCSIEAGFVWSDLITNMERVSDHCSNIAGCVIDLDAQNMNLHESLKQMRGESPFYRKKYAEYAEKYSV
jgi:phosphate:Na+ symporter